MHFKTDSTECHLTSELLETVALLHEMFLFQVILQAEVFVHMGELVDMDDYLSVSMEYILDFTIKKAGTSFVNKFCRTI